MFPINLMVFRMTILNVAKRGDRFPAIIYLFKVDKKNTN